MPKSIVPEEAKSKRVPDKPAAARISYRNLNQPKQSIESIQQKKAPKQAITRKKISLRPSLDPSSADVYILYTFQKITNCIHRCSPRGNPLASLWPFHDSRRNLTNDYLWKLELSQFQTQTLAVEKQNYSWKDTVGPSQSQKFARRLPLQNATSAGTGAEVHEMLLSKVDLWGGKCRRRESGTCHIATCAGPKCNHFSNFEKLMVGRFQVRR